MNEGGTGLLTAEVLATLHALSTRFEEALEPLGLSLAKFGLLSKLVAAGEPLPLSTLAERQACVRSNITQLVDRLEAEGLVRRAPDPRDRRSIRAELTAEGRARHAAGRRTLERAEAEAFAPIAAPRRKLLLEMLVVLRTRS